VSHLLETNISQSIVKTTIRTVNFDVWVNIPDRQGWADNHDDWVW
jgi:hypothetical protein